MNYQLGNVKTCGDIRRLIAGKSERKYMSFWPTDDPFLSSLNGAEGGAKHVGLIRVPKGARVVALLPLAPVALVAEPP